jgi:hypothetical protein
VRRLLGLAIAGFGAFTGIEILRAEDCQSVSFDGQGGRIAVAQCFADSSGALPAWLAGGGLIALGVLIGLALIRR